MNHAAMKAGDPQQGGSPLPSPCINVCKMDPASGLCLGCWRTISEIAAWSSADEASRRAIRDEIARRRGK